MYAVNINEVTDCTTHTLIYNWNIMSTSIIKMCIDNLFDGLAT
jgi:hypothetical protein